MVPYFMIKKEEIDHICIFNNVGGSMELVLVYLTIYVQLVFCVVMSSMTPF